MLSTAMSPRYTHSQVKASLWLHAAQLHKVAHVSNVPGNARMASRSAGLRGHQDQDRAARFRKGFSHG